MNGKYTPKLTPIRSSPHFAQQLGRTNSSPAILNQTPRGAKIDPQVYTDTQSKGLSSRIVLYYDRNHREPKPIINRLYNRAGEFPVVHMNQKTSPTHRYRRGSLTIAHSSPQIKIPAPEDSLYQSCTRSEILRTGSLMSHPTLQEANQLNLSHGDGDTLAPLDALKEISRKRIHCDHIDGDPNKKQKPEATVAATTGVSTKRQRDTISPNTKSNFGGAQKKRPCTKNNDILSSLSSSLTIITPKRKKDETRSGHQLSFQSESQPSIKHRRNDTVDYNETLVSRPQQQEQQQQQQQQQQQKDNVLRQPVEIDLTTPPPYNNGFVAIQRSPTAPTTPKLTLFNKAYVPIAKRLESPIDNLNTDDDDDDEAKISYVKPKKCINTAIGTNSTKPPVEKTKLALMLSCLSGDLDDFDTIDASVTVTPPTPAAPSIQTLISTTPIEIKLPSPIVSVAEPIKSTTASIVATSTIHTMPSISTTCVLLTSPIKFTIATDMPTELKSLPAPQRKGGFAFSPNKPDALVSIAPEIPATSASPVISFTVPKPAISTVVVSSAASVSPPRFAPSLPFSQVTFGGNKPTTTSNTATTTSVASPPNSSVAPISFVATPLFGSSPITGISSFTTSTTATSVTPATAPAFSFGNATVEPPKTTGTTTTTPSFGITKPINSQQFDGTVPTPAFQSVASVAFGSPSTAFQTQQAPSFGSANSSFSKPTPSFGSDPKAATSFGAPATTAFVTPTTSVLSQSNSSTFTFGGGMTTQPKTLSFGTDTTDKPISFGAVPTPSSNQPSISSLGIAVSSSSSFGAAQITSPFSGNAAPSFGSNQFSAPQKPVSFGSGTSSTATPSFGESTAKPTPFGSNTAAKPIFGNASTTSTFNAQQSTAVVPPASSNGMFGQQQNTQIGSFAFGGSAAAAPTTTTAGFSFNGTAAPLVSTQAPGAFSFGGTAAPPKTSSVPATTSSSAFSFGGVATAQPAPATASTFAFGGSTAASTSAATSSFGFSKPTASSGPFSFGGGATTTPNAPKPSISSFNTAQTAAPSFNSMQSVAPSFNSAQTAAPSFSSAQTAAPSFSFSGNQSSQTVAPNFGGSISFGGVGAQQPNGGSSTFAFGGNNSANATNTQNVTPTSFSFSTQQLSASSNNMFGTPVAATPSASPAPFAFGGSSSNSDGGSGTSGGAFNFSAQQSPGGNLFTAGPSIAPKGRVIRQASRRINK